MRRANGTRHRARRTAAQWRKLVERFERSGQTRGKFCAAKGLARSTFDVWRRKLGPAVSGCVKLRINGEQRCAVLAITGANDGTDQNPAIHLYTEYVGATPASP